METYNPCIQMFSQPHMEYICQFKTNILLRAIRDKTGNNNRLSYESTQPIQPQINSQILLDPKGMLKAIRFRGQAYQTFAL